MTSIEVSFSFWFAKCGKRFSQRNSPEIIVVERLMVRQKNLRVHHFAVKLNWRNFRKAQAGTVEMNSCGNLRKQTESNRNHRNYGQNVWIQVEIGLACSIQTVWKDYESACNDTHGPSTENIHKFQLRKICNQNVQAWCNIAWESVCFVCSVQLNKFR